MGTVVAFQNGRMRFDWGQFIGGESQETNLHGCSERFLATDQAKWKFATRRVSECISFHFPKASLSLFSLLLTALVSFFFFFQLSECNTRDATGQGKKKNNYVWKLLTHKATTLHTAHCTRQSSSNATQHISSKLCFHSWTISSFQCSESLESV